MLRILLTAILIFSHLVLPSLARRTTPQGTSYQTPNPQTHFKSIDIYIDSDDQALAAYQFELKAQPDTIKIVGVEGGDHPAFKAPPYYDPAALNQDRIIIAAYSTEQDLPSGQTRIARVHLQVNGDIDPEYHLLPITSANKTGQKIITTFTSIQGR